jgi:chorismate mutase
MAENDLRRLRDRIDVVDRELLDVLEQRVRLVIELWRVKQVRGLPQRDADRESEIVSRLASERSGLLSDESIRDFARLVDEMVHERWIGEPNSHIGTVANAATARVPRCEQARREPQRRRITTRRDSRC